MHTWRVPPTCTSILATGMVAPGGPYQDLKCSGSVHISQTRATGASKIRSITTASWEPSLSVIGMLTFRLRPELPEVVVHPIEAGLPDRPVVLGPGRHRFEGCRVQRTRSVLGLPTPY